MTGYKDAYVGRMDNYLIRHPSCINVTKWNAVVCSGSYAQVGQNALSDPRPPAPDSTVSVRSTLQIFWLMDTSQSMIFFFFKVVKKKKNFIRNRRLIEFDLKFPHYKPI